MMDLTRDRSLLTTAPVAAQLPEHVPEARMLHGWLDSWSGVGHVVEGMHDLGYDVRLTQSPFVWWAEFCERRSPRCHGGSGRATTPRPQTSPTPGRGPQGGPGMLVSERDTLHEIASLMSDSDRKAFRRLLFAVRAHGEARIQAALRDLEDSVPDPAGDEPSE